MKKSTHTHKIFFPIIKRELKCLFFDFSSNSLVSQGFPGYSSKVTSSNSSNR